MNNCEALTLVCGLETSLLPVIKTNTELDLWDAANAKVTNSRGRGGRCRGGRSGGGYVRGTRLRHTGRRARRNDTSLIVDDRNAGKVGLDPEDCIECVCLGPCLRRLGIGCSLSSCTGILSSLISLAFVGQFIADELSDDIDSLG